MTYSTTNDFIIGEHLPDVNSPVKKIIIAKSDILRVWEQDGILEVYLKSKQNDNQRYIKLRSTINDIIKQL